MSLTRKAIGGSIHRIREFELEKVNLADEFDILQIVGEGWFGKILLTEHRSTQTEMVLKALPKTYTGISDFYREFHYGLHLSAHRNVITTYDVAFETAGFYVFSQEYAPLGDLTSNVTETGLGELHAKRVVRQLAAAIHHIHSRELVHRDIKLDNVLVFRSDFSRIKLCDFGETRRVHTPVRRHNEWLPYSPPEVLHVDTDETYKASTVHDVWQFGVVLFVCLTGCLPWQKATSDDPWYVRYQTWHSATLNIAKKPKLFQLISSRAQRMLKRFLDPRPEKRAASVLEVNKYLEDRWLAKLGAEKALNGGADERDELCPSMYSFHSSLEEKNQLLFTLTQYGIETTVNRTEKKDRIREWIRSSAIREENEGESDVGYSENEDESKNGGGGGGGDDDDSDDNLNVRGRHFPESRESSRVTNDVRTVRRNSRAKPQARSTERRNPFTPQVAKERQAIAQSASFPNGDFSLALKSNDGHATPDHNDNAVRRFDGSEESSVTARSKDEPDGTNSLGTNSSENSVSTSLDGITGPSSFANEIPEEKERASTTGPRVPARKCRSQTQAPVTATVSRSFPARRSRSAKLPLSRTVDANQSASPLTMSVASRLVMQSFNSLQATNDRKDVARLEAEESTTYGKDAYGHYGIAQQGAVAKVNVRPRHDSYAGSGSRSASH